MGNVQVGAAIAASFRFVGEAWTKAWGVMLLLLWFTAVLQVVQVLKPTWGSVSLLGVIPTLFTVWRWIQEVAFIKLQMP